jgi:hypothetical protein
MSGQSADDVTEVHVRNAAGPVIGTIRGGQVTFVSSPDGSLAYSLTIAQRCLLTAGLLILAGILAALAVFTQSSSETRLPVWMVVAALVAVGGSIAPWRAMLPGREPSRPRMVTETLRDHVLARVQLLWIDQALNRSLRQVVRIEVGLDEQADAVADPWDVSRLDPLGASEPLPAGTQLVDVYRTAGRRLLLIGEPGAGKTTQLLELTDVLIRQARADEHAPAPVVLKLSEWTGVRSRLDDWIVEELGLRYSVPTGKARAALEAGHLTLLLDGLDEVAPERRAACAAEIDLFCRDDRFAETGVVVTCRRTDYDELGRRLAMGRGIALRPLGTEQVRQILHLVGPRFAALRSAFEQSQDLQDLLVTPLMLSVAVLATSDLSPGTPIQGARLYPMYVMRMLHRSRSLREPFAREDSFPFAHADTVKHLIWLARLMNQNDQTVFYPDWITPGWVPDRSAPWPLPNRHGPAAMIARRIGWANTSTALVGAGYAGLITTLCGAPLGAVVGGWRGALAVSVIAACLTGGLVALVFGVILRTRLGARLGLVVGDADATLHSATRWKWSWPAALKGMGPAAVGAVVVATVGMPLSTVPNAAAVFVVMVLGGLIGGGSVPDHNEPVTSPGLALSSSRRRIAFQVTVLASVVTAAAILLALVDGPWTATVATLPLATAVTLVSGPGRAWLRSRAAKFGLTAAGLLPSNLVEFLVHADERVLLRQAGGGFQFVHRTMQEYVAEQDPDSYYCRLLEDSARP